jgi:hypothetical protein
LPIVATLRERRPGVWEVRVFTGSDAQGRPTQLSRTVHGGKRDALRVAAEMEVHKGRARSAGRFVGDVLDAWVDQSLGTWAPSSARDQQSRVVSIKKDPIARIPEHRLMTSLRCRIALLPQGGRASEAVQDDERPTAEELVGRRMVGICRRISLGTQRPE